MALSELDFRLKKLFVVAKGMEMSVGQTEFDELFYALLDEVEQVKEVYDEKAQELLTTL